MLLNALGHFKGLFFNVDGVVIDDAVFRWDISRRLRDCFSMMHWFQGSITVWHRTLCSLPPFWLLERSTLEIQYGWESYIIDQQGFKDSVIVYNQKYSSAHWAWETPRKSCPRRCSTLTATFTQPSLCQGREHCKIKHDLKTRLLFAGRIMRLTKPIPVSPVRNQTMKTRQSHTRTTSGSYLCCSYR